MSRLLHHGFDRPDLANDLHEFGIAGFEPGANVVAERAPAKLSAYLI